MGRIDVTQEVLDQLFTKYDQNNDGSIDFPEYLEMMVQLQEEKKKLSVILTLKMRARPPLLVVSLRELNTLTKSRRETLLLDYSTPCLTAMNS